MIYTRWQRQATNTVRLFEIFQVFAKYGFYDFLSRLGLLQRLPWSLYRQIKEGFPDIDLTWGERLRRALTELGPTFIKMGQILSTRPDLVGSSIAQELSLLQDRVAPLPYEEIVKTIENAFNKPINEIYPNFDSNPIAAGSLSQVHKAVLKDGRSVAVKVKRAGIDRIIAADIELMKTIATWLEGHPDVAFLRPLGIVNEFARSIRRELNFLVEARIIQVFRKNMMNQKNVLIPNVFKGYTTPEILTMEWVDGVRIDQFDQYEARNCDRKTIARLGCEILCKMICEDRLFHADPHPGNIFITCNNQIAFLDLGMAGNLDAQDVMLITNLLMSIFHQDVKQCTKAVLALCSRSDFKEIKSLENEISDFLAFEAYLIISTGQVGKGIERAIEILRNHGLELESRFTLLLKALATIESVGRQLDPELDFVSIIQPYFERFILSKYELPNLSREITQQLNSLWRFFVELPDDVRSITTQMRSGELKFHVHHEYLEKLANILDKSSSRISISMITSALIVGSSLLVTTSSATKNLGTIGFSIAGVLAIYLIISILFSKKL